MGVRAGRGDAARGDPGGDLGGGGATDLSGAVWRKSTRSSGNGGDRVEVADSLPGVVGVRDSKDRQGAGAGFHPGELVAFLWFARRG